MVIEYNYVTSCLLYVVGCVNSINAAIPIPEFIQFLAALYTIHHFNLLSNLFIVSALSGIILYNLLFYKTLMYFILACIAVIVLFKVDVNRLFRTILYHAFVHRAYYLCLPEFYKLPLGRYRYYIKLHGKTVNITYFIILNCDFSESYGELLQKCKEEYPDMEENTLIIRNINVKYIMDLEKGVQTNHTGETQQTDIAFGNIWFHIQMLEDDADGDDNGGAKEDAKEDEDKSNDGDINTVVVVCDDEQHDNPTVIPVNDGNVV